MSYLIESSNDQCILKLYVQPAASKNEIVGTYGDPPRLKVKIKAQPQDGAANSEIISFVAKLLGISQSKIQILRGHTSRSKDLIIDLNSKTVQEKII